MVEIFNGGDGEVLVRATSGTAEQVWGSNAAALQVLPVLRERLPLSKGASVESVQSQFTDKCSDFSQSDGNYGPSADLHWRFNFSIGGSYVPQLFPAIDRGGDYLTGNISNPCGFSPAAIGRHAVYDGSTNTSANIYGSTGDCATDDGLNTINFGLTAPGLLAKSCYWFKNFPAQSTVKNADVAFKYNVYWAASPGSGPGDNCPSGYYRLDDTAAHEFGHIFGLLHVSSSSASVMRDPNGWNCAASGISHGDYSLMSAKY